MQLLNIQFILLLVSSIAIFIILFNTLHTKKLNQLKKFFSSLLICVLIMSVGVIFQLIFSTYLNVNPIYFENIIYIGTCFLPVSLYFTALTFKKTKIKFKKRYLLLFIIPITTLIVLFTNSHHSLFYKHYSLNMNEMVFGSYFYIHTAYTYLLLAISIIILIRSSLKNSGVFSKQIALIIIGTLIPIITNVLGTLKLIEMTVCLTPISFSLSMLCYAVAIFKFNFLGVAPIALQKIVDKISDSYVILDENGIITDFNKTLLDTFKLKDSDIRNKPIMNMITSLKIDLDKKQFNEKIQESKKANKTLRYEKYFGNIERYFNTEITPIFSDDMFLGTIILLKDITQHKQDIQTIRNNQDMLMEQERLASLGQLIGGISHNLKTPIMSISGAAEGLNDLIKEYEASVGDPEVTVQDHHDIAKDMYTWTEKIKSYTEYMSDIITTVKGQAVTLSSENDVDFTIDELIKRVDILMKHELKNALITLNTHINIDPATTLDGDVNSLVQVVNNLIQNAIQAYGGETNKDINLNINKENNNIIIAVQDFGMGMSDEIKKKLFKEMITTKGKNGSGLGLFMSYSTIKAHFKGDLTFESEQGKGTTFYIRIPV